MRCFSKPKLSSFTLSGLVLRTPSAPSRLVRQLSVWTLHQHVLWNLLCCSAPSGALSDHLPKGSTPPYRALRCAASISPTPFPRCAPFSFQGSFVWNAVPCTLFRYALSGACSSQTALPKSVGLLRFSTYAGSCGILRSLVQSTYMRGPSWYTDWGQNFPSCSAAWLLRHSLVP